MFLLMTSINLICLNKFQKKSFIETLLLNYARKNAIFNNPVEKLEQACSQGVDSCVRTACFKLLQQV